MLTETQNLIWKQNKKTIGREPSKFVLHNFSFCFPTSVSETPLPSSPCPPARGFQLF